jgi:4-hydroxybenzoate polyprenyltransferase
MSNDTQRKLPFVRLLAILSLVHWKNVLITSIAQYSASVFSLSNGTWKETLQNPDLHLIVLATACVIAAGFIINAFYDYEKDLINQPAKTVFGRLISKTFAFRAYLILNTLGLLLALMASFNIFIFFALFAFALWLYSHKLQKMVFLREVTGAILSITSFFSIVIYYRHLTSEMLIYGLMFTLLLAIRALIKNIRGHRGDVVMGYETVTVKFGLRKSLQAAYLIHLPLLLLACWMWWTSDGLMGYAMLVLCMLSLGSLLWIWLAKGWSNKMRGAHALSTFSISLAAISTGGVN